MALDDEIRASYDRSFYVTVPKPQAHPVHLATLAMLFGMAPPAPGASRILEMGCGTGTNLLAIARDLPAARLVGIDLSPAQIMAGRAEAARQSLSNVELIAGSITDLTADAGQFDYVVCHGVFSWVPHEVREAILRICRENLSPQGVAYISYNTYPGRRAFEGVREMMRFHTARLADDGQRISEARSIVALAAKPAPHNLDGGAPLADEARRLDSAADFTVLHDYLAPINESLYFTQFNDLIQQAGLQYLGESNPASMILSIMGPDVTALVRGHAADLIEAEQYMDFMRNRRFRETLVCHADVALDRRFDASRVRRMSAASSLRPRSPDAVLVDDTPVTFEFADDNQITITSPLTKAALLALSNVHPRYMQFEELVDAARQQLKSTGVTAGPAQVERLANDLFDAFLANLLQFRCAQTYTAPGVG